MLKNLFQRFSGANISIAAWLLILAGSFTWSLTMVKSGLIYPFGMGFWGPNGHDGVWHISLTESLSTGSWQIPVFAGESLKNYHVGFDLILASLHKLTFIPIHTLYFQILPPILALLIGYFVYKFVYSWFRSRAKAFWATFFIYFGGNWGWVITLIREGKFGGESMFWSQQSISTLVNPPYALSVVFLFAGLYHLRRGLRYKSESRWRLVLATFLFGALVQIKVYAGILVISGLFTAGIWRMLKRRGISLVKVATGALVLSILLLAPITKDLGQTIIFKPFWFLETMMSDTGRLYWPRFAEAMINYKLAGNWIKGIAAYAVAFFIFWFGNLGTRIIKEPLVFDWLKNWRKATYIEVFFGTVIAAGGLIPMFFVQSGTPWNTIQFMYYALAFSGILAGVWLGELLEAKKQDTILIYIIIVLIVGLTFPTTIGTLRHYLPARPPAKISHQELEALAFLRSQSDGIVLTLPFDKEAARAAEPNPPRPLYLYESTAYVSAFSGQPVYLEDEVNLDITGYDWGKRRDKVQTFLSADVSEAKEFLSNNGIEYIYWQKPLIGRVVDENALVEIIFENDEVQILSVR